MLVKFDTYVNEDPYNFWVCIHDDGSILTGEQGFIPAVLCQFLN